MKAILLLICALAVNVANADDTAIVKTENGLVRGKLQSSILNQVPFYSFRGIPYAAPPTGNFRFREPQPVQNWKNIKDALNYGSSCPQTCVIKLFYDRSLPDNPQGDEDCLFINVFTPNFRQEREKRPLKPVLVYVHGGGYFTGSSDDLFYGPDHLMEENVVYVSFNYRLGALGFLALENTDAPGNYGLKDTVQALKWVKKNIAAFGGDPDCVTIFGQSAGGSSTSLLMVSELARGLFHRVISQSGTLVHGWAINEQRALPRAFKLGEFLGYKTDNATELLEFLRTQDALKIAKYSALVIPDPYDKLPDYITSVQLPFSPTIEPIEVGAQAFLTQDPVDLLKSGKFPKLPVIIGHTTQEYIFFVEKSDLKQDALESTIANLRLGLPVRNVRVRDNSPEYSHVLNTLKNSYSLNQFTNATPENYIQLQSDIWFAGGAELAARIQVEVSTNKTFFYRFNYNGGLNHIKVNKGFSTVYPGASHSDEYCYIFYCRDLKEAYTKLDKNSGDYKMIKIWTRLYANFARTGNPTPVLDPVLDNVKWIPRTREAANVLNIDDTVAMSTIPKDNIYDTWTDLMKYLKTSAVNTEKRNE